MTVLTDKPELKWIKLTQLYVPTEYQRSTKSNSSTKNINYIKLNFNWADCGTLIVCPLKGSKPPQYAIIDGQHRFRAAEARGDIAEIPCVVISEREADAQALNFVVINKRRVKLHPLQEYHAAVVAGDPDATALNDILKKCNIEMAAHAFSTDDTHPHVTQSVGTLLKMTHDFSEKQMCWILTIIPEAYGEARGMMRSCLIKVLGQFLKAHPDADRATMIAALQEIDVEDLQGDARAYRQIQGGSTTSAMLKVLERRYNAVKRAA
jgi:hypothetical protein